MSPDLPIDAKPLDFGFGGLMGCLNNAGRVTALNAYHPQHGVVSITSAAPFPDAERYNPAFVRAYRKNLLRMEGVGLAFDLPVVRRSVDYFGDVPLIHITFADGSVAECATVSHPAYGITQFWRCSRALAGRLTGRIWIQRSAYAQLTEGGPLPSVSADTAIGTCDSSGCVGLENRGLGWALCLGPADGAQAQSNTDGSVTIQAELVRRSEFTIHFAIGSTLKTAEAAFSYLTSLDPVEIPAELSGEVADRIEARAWRYTHLCSVPVAAESTCILTDHMILPLAWNRDAYYAARLLLSDPKSWETVRRHLIWMFETAERVNGLWGRSYLANGRVKDRGFQLDQQLFPLLELVDYVQITGDRASLDRLKVHIAPIFEHLAPHRASHALLYATEETPADDPIALPYPLSSHVLLWRVLKQLDVLGCAELLPVSPAAVAESIQRHFVGKPMNSDEALYAYATDGHGLHHFYHDANDIPLVLMPAWGFCTADDPLWRATISFAFSPANEGGYYEKSLGSVHTRAPWPLGDVQEWIVARTLGDHTRAEQVLQRLHRASQWDGALPEAYDVSSGEVVSRHWFLWPNAVYACTKLGVFDP